MSTLLAEKGIRMSRCSSCGHDLTVRKPKGLVYCSNGDCTYSRKAHPTRDQVNEGPK